MGKHWAKTYVKAFFVYKKISSEGESIPNYFLPLRLENYGTLIWPLEIVHRITESSPLWNVSAQDLLTSR